MGGVRGRKNALGPVVPFNGVRRPIIFVIIDIRPLGLLALAVGLEA